MAFEATGVGGLRDGAWSFADTGDQRAHITLVTGPPASGKSQWLRAVAAHKEAVAAYGSMGWLASIVDRSRPAAKTSATWALTTDEQLYGGLSTPLTSSDAIVDAGGGTTKEADPCLLGVFDRWDLSAPLGRVMSIPALRLPLPPPSGASDFKNEQRMTALAADAAKLTCAIGVIKRALRGQGEDRDAVTARDLVERFDVGARIAGIAGDGDLELALRGGQRIPLAAASTSQQQAVALAALYAATRPRNSIVLFDTPEAGLPPGLASRWIEALRTTDDNQWIVATADPGVVRELGSQVIELTSHP